MKRLKIFLASSIREFKEETGMTITKQHYVGHNTIEYPDRIFEFKIYLVDDYSGDPLEFEENYSMWINVDDLYKEERLFPNTFPLIRKFSFWNP